MLINHFNLEKYPIEPKNNQRSKEESLNKRICVNKPWEKLLTSNVKSCNYLYIDNDNGMFLLIK